MSKVNKRSGRFVNLRERVNIELLAFWCEDVRYFVKRQKYGRNYEKQIILHSFAYFFEN